MKQVIIAVIVIVAIIGAAVIFGKDDQATGAPSNNFYGNEQAEVVLVEYGDFECPACNSFQPIVKQIKEEFKDQIKVEFRHFPLVQIHGNATAAHRAAEAAANQGKFWEMHDKLYETQAAWKSSAVSGSPATIFEGYAEELGLDMEQYKTDVADSSTLGTINADVALGKEKSVDSTPTFTLNGKKIESTTAIDSVAEFRKIIEEALGIENTDDTQPIEDTESTKPEEALAE